jgi:hypothetical protein
MCFVFFVSKYLMAFSVSIINALIKCFGSFSIVYLNPIFKVFVCLFVPDLVLFVLSLIVLYGMYISLFLCYGSCRVCALVMRLVSVKGSPSLHLMWN